MYCSQFCARSSTDAENQTLNTSPRNSLEGQVHLLAETRCKTFFYSREMEFKIKEMAMAVHGKLQTVEVPEYDQLLSSSLGSSGLYPFSKSYEEIAAEPALIFHTSGSTGLPKPITLRHNYLASLDNISTLPVPEGREQANWCALRPGNKYFNALPAFHAAGATFNLYAPIFSGTVFVLQAHPMPLSEDSFLKVSTAVDLTAAWLPPSFLEDVSASPSAYEQLSKLKYLFYGGGPLSAPAGDRLNKTVNLIQMMGGTEMGLAAGLVSKKWRYFEWNPNYGFV